MREFKCRAWDIENRVMIYSDDNPKDNHVFIIGNGGLQFYYIDSDRYLMDTNSIKLQYTGLKDRHGAEVYEGDILEVGPEKKDLYHESSIFIVNSIRNLWGYEFNWKHVSGYECSTHIARTDNENKQLLNVEIIGNIYEHPHLLEVD